MTCETNSPPNISVLATIWEALSPDPVLSPYEKDYRWLTQVMNR